MTSARSFARFTLLAAGSAFVLSTLAAAPALACGGEWYPMFQVDVRIPGVDLAEEELEQGRTLAAAGAIVRMIPHIRQLDPTKTKLIQRAHRVLAVATARFDGALRMNRCTSCATR